MPREERAPRPSARQRRFSEIGQLLQLQNAVQEPAQREAELANRQQASNINAMLSVLGLAQEAKLRGDQLAQDRELKTEQNELSRTRSLVDMLTLMGQPNAPEVIGEVGAARFPEIAAGQKAVQGRKVAGDVQKMTPLVQALYKSLGSRPEELKAALPMIEQTNPEAFKQLDWNALNASLEGTATPASNLPVAQQLGETVRQAPSALAKGAQAFNETIVPLPGQFVKGVTGMSDSTERSINDFLNSIINAPGEGVQFYKQKLTKKSR